MKYVVVVLAVLFFLAGCSQSNQSNLSVNRTLSINSQVDRESVIPIDQIKITPETDVYPLISYSDEYTDPVPMPYPINTRGAEDGGFMMPDGKTYYTWFTPSPSIPVEEQLFDQVTGIYVSYKTGDTWSTPERVMLQDTGKVALDGCTFVLNNTMWFCSAREGYTGMPWFTAEYANGSWGNIQEVNFDPEYEVGELFITPDGNEMYFGSARPGGKGDLDIWLSRKINGEWAEPENIWIVNTLENEGWPMITPNGDELWFTRIHGWLELWRSKKVMGEWQEPEKMFAPFAGESSVDIDGNVYFTHHFYKDNKMLEADYYVAHHIR